MQKASGLKKNKDPGLISMSFPQYRALPSPIDDDILTDFTYSLREFTLLP
jgi:hypothetical protein